MQISVWICKSDRSEHLPYYPIFWCGGWGRWKAVTSAHVPIFAMQLYCPFWQSFPSQTENKGGRRKISYP